MKKNFVESAVVRQNVLNNTIAMDTLQQTLSLDGVMFESKLTFIKRQVAEFFEVTERTIDYCIEKNEKEIAKNGYEVLRGKRLVDYKLAFQKHFGNETDFVTKTTVLGIFDFRAFLNVAMLLTDSEKARSLRSAILDVVIDTINKRTGGSTKYINQRDEDFVSNIKSAFNGLQNSFTDIGENAMLGLQNGISSMASSVWEKAKAIAEDIPSSAIDNTFKILEKREFKPKYSRLRHRMNMVLSTKARIPKTVCKTADVAMLRTLFSTRASFRSSFPILITLKPSSRF